MIFSLLCLVVCLLFKESIAENSAAADGKLAADNDYVRFGRSDANTEEEKKSGDYVRFGRSFDGIMDEQLADYLARDIRNGDYVRFGRSSEKGYSSNNQVEPRVEADGETIDFGQLLDELESDEFDLSYPISDLEKRAAVKTYVRMGKRFQEELEKRASRNFVRMGRRMENTPMKKGKSYIRMGRSAEFEKKDGRNYVRMGRSNDKRGDPNFIRMGRNVDFLERLAENRDDGRSFLRMRENIENYDELENDKRQAKSYVRMGKSSSQSDALDNDKRGDKGFVRMGKSPDSFMAEGLTNGEGNYVRMGRKLLSINEEGKEHDESELQSLTADKKALKSYIRMSKKSNDEEMEKRAKTYIRMGKSSDNSEDADITKRAGKTFLRMGKSGEEQLSDFLKSEQITDSRNLTSGEKEKLQEEKLGENDFEKFGKNLARNMNDFQMEKGKSDKDIVSIGQPYGELTANELEELGKRAGKTYIRMGKNSDESGNEKRSSKLYIRMGRDWSDKFGSDDKRANYIRMGRDSNSDFIQDVDESIDKRSKNRHYVRFGRNSNNRAFDGFDDSHSQSKRSKHYVRFGKRFNEDAAFLDEQGDASATGGDYVRFG